MTSGVNNVSIGTTTSQSLITGTENIMMVLLLVHLTQQIKAKISLSGHLAVGESNVTRIGTTSCYIAGQRAGTLVATVAVNSLGKLGSITDPTTFGGQTTTVKSMCRFHTNIIRPITTSYVTRSTIGSGVTLNFRLRSLLTSAILTTVSANTQPRTAYKYSYKSRYFCINHTTRERSPICNLNKINIF